MILLGKEASEALAEATIVIDKRGLQLSPTLLFVLILKYCVTANSELNSAIDSFADSVLQDQSIEKRTDIGKIAEIMTLSSIHAENRSAGSIALIDLVRAAFEFSEKDFLVRAARNLSIDILDILSELSQACISSDSNNGDNARDPILSKKFVVVVSGPNFEDTSNTYASLEDANRAALRLRARIQSRALPEPKPGDGYVLIIHPLRLDEATEVTVQVIE